MTKKSKRPKFYHCGCCDLWHPCDFDGDCRDDNSRFSTGQLDTLFPDTNNDGWPDWVEVDEE